MLGIAEEQKLFNQGYQLVGGIDEAGRGPLAGPVAAACAVIGDGFEINNDKLKLIADSKKLTAKRREELFDVINELFSEVSIGLCDHKTIDRINILQASFLAMKKAIGALKQKPDFIMIDGKFQIPNCSYQQKAIISGDKLIFSIAAASIIAKVARDRIMVKAHELYPQYGFDKHKGYGTKLHLENIKKYGPCLIHRMSFKPLSPRRGSASSCVKAI